MRIGVVTAFRVGNANALESLDDLRANLGIRLLVVRPDGPPKLDPDRRQWVERVARIRADQSDAAAPRLAPLVVRELE